MATVATGSDILFGKAGFGGSETVGARPVVAEGLWYNAFILGSNAPPVSDREPR